VTAHGYVRHFGPLPPLSQFCTELEKLPPDGITVVLETTEGQEIQVGTLGDDDG
jgi:hypothetical protein